MKKLSSNTGYYLFLITVAIFFTTCKSYYKITETPDEFLGNKEISQHIDGYNVFVHSPGQSYVLYQPRVSSSSVYGTPKTMSDAALISETKSPTSKSQIKKHRKDINIYVSKDLASGSEIEIKKADISRADVYGVNKKGVFSSALAIVLIVLLIVGVAAGLVYALALGSQAGGTASGNASGQASGNSSGNSNSNSNSGGSGNSSGGSCYVATMVYGSYDAPEVLVLRKFRDTVLANSKAGRAFIRFYYRYSPGLVEKLRYNKKANLFIKNLLDKWVNHLSKKLNQ